MVKLWKVEVNGWGWDKPKTMYAHSRAEAEKIADKYPANGAVKYAGRFRDLKARVLTGTASYEEECVYNGDYGYYMDGSPVGLRELGSH